MKKFCFILVVILLNSPLMAQKALVGFSIGEKKEAVLAVLKSKEAQFIISGEQMMLDEFQFGEHSLVGDLEFVGGELVNFEVQSEEVSGAHSAKEKILPWFRNFNSLLQKDLGLPENLKQPRFEEIPEGEFTGYRKFQKDGTFVLLGLLRLGDVYAVRVLVNKVP